MCRVHLQTQEHRLRDRILGAIPEAQSEAYLITGQVPRGLVCFAPQLQEARKESAMLKYQRKAREERALARPK